MIISADVSYYQPKVDSSYPREWLIIRLCDGSYLDPNASFNADWCRGAVAQGRMLGWTGYVVYRPGQNGAILQNLIKLGGPWDRFMVDIESWSGQIRGDHSAEINSLIEDLSVLVGSEKVWRYGNQGDLANIHPHPVANQLTVVSGYIASRPNLPDLIGWQYTNGAENHTANPTTSAPFGACDHNELYVDELPPSGGGTGVLVPVLDQTDLDNIQNAVWFKSLTVGAGQSLAQDVVPGIETQLTTLISQVAALQRSVNALTPSTPGTPTAPPVYSITLTGTATPEASA